MPLRRFVIALFTCFGLSAGQAHAAPPRLIVAIAVDQFSADLFAQYRAEWTGGLARLSSGVVFPSGYQSHAATETCPGHSTILTGVRPARSGVIANAWIDQSVPRANKTVYCAEDEAQVAADPKGYVASPVHLLVPTLGEWMKQRWPASRNVAVAGKDRAALMMGGHVIDDVYWWKGKGFTTLRGRAMAPQAIAENAAALRTLAAGAPGLALPAWCVARDRLVTAGSVSVGQGRFALAAGDEDAFRASPRLDVATLDLALSLVDARRLGKGSAPDLLAVSLSATDYVGHATGTEGAEMCIQLHELDRALGVFLSALDARGIDYVVALTADHGGFDMPERLQQQGLPMAQRASDELAAAAIAARISPALGLDGKGLLQSDRLSGDIWIRRDLSPADKVRVTVAVKADLARNSQVAAVFSRDELVAAPMPTGSPETWNLLERARASYYPPRSGDIVLLLNRGIVSVAKPRPGSVATHGSPWDYDRRVPMLFWRAGISGFEQPNPVETVDIAPTLAALIGLNVPDGTFDGRCLDLDAGPGTTCGAKP